MVKKKHKLCPYCPIKFILGGIYTWGEHQENSTSSWVTVFSIKFTTAYTAKSVHNTVTPIFIGISNYIF